MPDLDYTLVDIIEKNGTKLGEQEPDASSKYSFYRLYRYEGKVYALVYQSSYQGEEYVCGHEIAESEINEYI